MQRPSKGSRKIAYPILFIIPDNKSAFICVYLRFDFQNGEYSFQHSGGNFKQRTKTNRDELIILRVH